MNLFHPDQLAWLSQVQEPALDPERPIVDPHHHLWRDMMGDVYTMQEYQADTATGHNVVGSVYMECGTEYRQQGPEAEQSLGETTFVLAQRDSAKASGTPLLGMVGHVDLTLGDAAEATLEQHRDLAGDFFKGIRHAGASAEAGVELVIPGAAPRDLFASSDFRRGVQLLGRLGLVYETWHYHFQNRDYLALAKACPDTTFVLDHFGTPLGVPPYDSQRVQIFDQWKADIAAIAACPNVHLKVGGLAMPDNGYGWHTAERPPTSDEFVAAQRDWYLHAIDCFGPERCMFESNFPVDRMSISYAVLYNGFKKMVADFSEGEKNALFFANANALYQLGL
jgi:predicted TIM-barrel fold metal-dependent hydrolase